MDTFSVTPGRTAPVPGAAEGSASTAAPSRNFASVLKDLAVSLDGGEQLMHRATRAGPGMDAGRLIALQAGIYRYTETVELASKLVDRASGAVRTTMQSQ